jgi:prophage maintenance system killer protein
MLNGYELVSSPADNVLTILRVADGSLSEEELTLWIRKNIKRRSRGQSADPVG